MIKRIIYAFVLSIFIEVICISPVFAWEVDNLTPIYIYDNKYESDTDTWFNYDFEDEEAYPLYENCDWPINIIFINNANQSTIKNTLTAYYGGYAGSAKWEYLAENQIWCGKYQEWVPDWLWNSDSGWKNNIFINWHIRFYTPDNYNFYNTSWGYYVIASTHYDYLEPLSWGYYGDSEDAEDYFVDLFTSGYFDYDWYCSLWLNNDITEDDGGHHWDSDGYAQVLWVD